MPYEKSTQKLQAFVQQVLADPTNPEIRDGLAKSKIDESVLYRAITKDAKEIWAVVSSETSEYDANESRLLAEEAKLSASLGSEPDPENARVGSLASGWLPGMLFGIGIFLAIGTIAIGWWRKGLLPTFVWLGSSTAGLVLLAFMVILIPGAFLLQSLLQRLSHISLERVRKTLQKEREKWNARKDAEEEDLGIKRLRSLIADLDNTIALSVIEKKIKPKLRFMINRGLEPSYENEFYIIGASGLAEVFDPSHAIDTSAKQRLRFMLENTAGGSIGIAGPRGAGKTTLILSYCGPKRTVDELNGQPLLSVMASAPVEYQGRDFILYLFSAVCRYLLEIHGETEDQAELQEPEETRHVLIAGVLRMLLPFARSFFYLGAALIAISIILAVLFAKYPPPATKPSTESKAAASAPGIQEAPAKNPEAPLPLEPLPIRFIRAFNVSPGAILIWGLVVAFVGRLVVWAESERYRFRYRSRYVNALANPNASSTLQLRDPEKRQVLIQDTRKWLRKIKFQQSYTSGWSGALKLPVGLEGGVNSAVTLAENQLSLPEIVHNFTRFLVQLSANYQVIIGIDELDKLESDAKAQRFLNEIKSIFGIERCFYLISVSENAMSNFERRGLPFRDAFDSSFDNIIYVDYLTFAGAKRLLAERVTGKPIPFFGLSYCLAGGLPRDLIRHFRHLVELSEREGKAGTQAVNDITTLCQELVSADLKAKIRAVGVAAKRLELEPDAGEFLEKVYRLNTDPPCSTQMLAIAGDMLCPSPQIEPTEANKELLNKHHKLVDLKSELAIYCLYLATLLEFFNNELDQKVLEAAEQEGAGLDQLAHARQVLAVDPDITFKLLNSFRLDNQLSPLPPLAKWPPPAAPAINTIVSPMA